MINKETAKVQYTTVAEQSTWYAVDFEYFTTPATGLPQLKVLLGGQELTAGTDYVTGPQGIQLVVAPTAGVSLVIERDIPFTQEIDFQMGLIDPEKIERGLDESVMRDQELANGISDLDAKHDSLAEEVEEVRTVAEGAAADAASAKQTATDAASAANSASEKADEAKTAADNADSKAQNALDLANSYDTRITTAQDTADSAKTTADSAKTTADQALAGLDGKQDKGDYATKTELSQGLADKQDKGDYATKTELTQGLAGKADTSVTDTLRNDVDGLDGQVSGIEEKIPADASSSNQLATKVDLSNIDALPSQAGNEGKFLTTDGANASWAEINQGAVSSVNGKTGAVVLNAEDVGAVEKNQGSENAGKFLKVGADGQVIASAESGGGGLAAVAHDATLEGDGTDGNPLKLSTATAAEITAAQSTADKADNAAEVAQQTANLAGQEAAQALSALAGKVNIAQGADNAGKVMTVGADGNLAPADAPAGGLPDQTGNAGKFLMTDGTSASWEEALVNNANNKTSSVAIGSNASSGKPNTVCVGVWSGSVAEGGVAIGANSYVSEEGAVQINSKPNGDQANNAEANTFKWQNANGNFTLFDENGTIPSERIAAGGNAGDVLTRTATGAEWSSAPSSLPDQTGNAGRFLTTDGSQAAWGDGITIVRASDAVTAVRLKTGFCVRNTSATTTYKNYLTMCTTGEARAGANYALAITVNATAPEHNSVVDGVGAIAIVTTDGDPAFSASEDRAIAIGFKAKSNGVDSIQLGMGTNNIDETFQVWDKQLLNKTTGLIPTERLASGGTTGQVLKKTDTGCEWGDIPDVSEFQTASQVTTIADTQADAAINSRFLVVDELPAEPDANTFYFIKKA